MNFGLVQFPCLVNDDRNGEVTRELQGTRQFYDKAGYSTKPSPHEYFNIQYAAWGEMFQKKEKSKNKVI